MRRDGSGSRRFLHPGILGGWMVGTMAVVVVVWVVVMGAQGGFGLRCRTRPVRLWEVVVLVEVVGFTTQEYRGRRLRDRK